MRLILPILLFAAAAASAPAQSCATLTVTGGAPGSTLTFALDGAPNSLALLAVGDTTGTTTFNFGSLGSLTLGLAQPFVPLPLGRTDANGEVSLGVTVPATLPPADLFAQGLTVSFTLPPAPGLSFCTSNVVSFHVGP